MKTLVLRVDTPGFARFVKALENQLPCPAGVPFKSLFSLTLYNIDVEPGGGSGRLSQKSLLSQFADVVFERMHSHSLQHLHVVDCLDFDREPYVQLARIPKLSITWDDFDDVSSDDCDRGLDI